MKEHVNNFVSRAKQQARHMTIFAIVFTVLGYFGPRIWLQYFDKTEYYKVDSPVKVEQVVYKPCDNAKILWHRTALIDLKARATINLFLKSADGKTKYNEAFRDLIVTKGKDTITTYWGIKDQNGGCNLPDGPYFYDGVVEYQIQGVTKQTFFSTESFLVKN